MSDLETRVRHALQEDTVWRSADALLDDVRRGARRRRARRTTGLVAAAALVLTAAGGGLAWRHRELQAADHSRGPDHLSGALAVSVSASGTVFKVVGNQGCTRPCSTIWKQNGSGAWTRLAALRQNSVGARLWGPVLALEMAPNGRDGWAWGTYLWSTHDGGTTWSRVTSLPGTSDPTYNNLDLVPGPEFTWARVSSGPHRELWRTPTGSDDWTQVRLPKNAQTTIAAVLPDSRVAIPVVRGVDEYQRVRHHGKVVALRERYVVGDGTGPWQHVLVPCYRVAYPFHEQRQRTELCGPNGRVQQGGGLIGPKTSDGTPRFKISFVTLGTVPYGPSDPLGRSTELAVSSAQAFLGTPAGAIPVDLHLDSLGGIQNVASQGRHSVFLNRDHRIYATDDGGRHWHELR